MIHGPAFPEQPVLARVWRGDHVESQHRGSWALVDGAGQVLEGAGDWSAPIYTRSAVKVLQALPLVESGAADRFGLGPDELALALASHNGEELHTAGAAKMLGRLDLDEGSLLCGAHYPDDPAVRARLGAAGEKPGPLHNNCSGKHAGFLTLAKHLDADIAGYLDPAGPVQLAVRSAVGEVTNIDPAALDFAIDGCSAPTWRMPLASLGRAFASVSTPASLGTVRAAACERLTAAAAEFPAHVAGNHRRLCTALLRASGGRLFPKIGAEGVYVVGQRGAGRALVAKIDDGGNRALHALVTALLERFGWLESAPLESLHAFRGNPLRNRAGLEIGRIEVCLP